MHDDDSPGGALAAYEEDERDQEAILELVLQEHPIRLTPSDLMLQVVGRNPAFADSDRIERGVGDLVGFGLLYRAAPAPFGRPARRCASTTSYSIATPKGSSFDQAGRLRRFRPMNLEKCRPATTPAAMPDDGRARTA